MPTAVKMTTVHFPFPLGKLIGGATWATVAIPLTQNFTPVMVDGVTPDDYFNEILVQTNPTNTGNVYVLVPTAALPGGSPPDLTNYTNVAAILVAGASWPRSRESWKEQFNVTDYWLGFANATDFCIGSVTR